MKLVYHLQCSEKKGYLELYDISVRKVVDSKKELITSGGFERGILSSWNNCLTYNPLDGGAD